MRDKDLLYCLISIALPYGWAVTSFLAGDDSTGYVIMCAAATVDLLVETFDALRSRDEERIKYNRPLLTLIWLGGIAIITVVAKMLIPSAITVNSRIMMPIWIATIFLLLIPEFLKSKNSDVSGHSSGRSNY